MDRKSIIILAISALLFASWYMLIGKIFPPKPILRSTNSVVTVTNFPGSNQPVLTAITNAPTITPLPNTPIATNQPEETLVITNDNARYTITSHGGGIKTVELFHYP